MKQVYYIPISSNEKDTEDKINEAIRMIESRDKVDWIVELCKSTDASKYMLVGEKSDSTSVVPASTSIGVKVIQGSQDKAKTEQIINKTLLNMELDGDKSFVSISHPYEFMYIILFEYKAGEFPRVKIIPNPADPYMGSRKVSTLLQNLEEDPEWIGMEPYDSFMLDEDNMVILFSEE